MLKVLHVWNTAGVGSIVAKFMDRAYGTKSWVIMRKEFDPFGMTTLGECIAGSARKFKYVSLWKALRFDILHVHAADSLVPFFRRWLSNKSLVLHYHGDIRGRWKERQPCWKEADALLVSTPDLLENAPTQATYLPNPIDTEIFKPLSENIRDKTSAVTFSYSADDLAIALANRNGLKLRVLERNIPHLEVPHVLCEFEYYIDVKRDWRKTILASLSKTGLEALACGLRVVDWKGDIHEGLPLQHHPENVVRSLYEMYVRLERAKDVS